MIAKTKTLNNSAFFILAAVSLFMSLWLFWQFGSNVFSATLLAICGAGVEMLKILNLLIWRNQFAMKQKKKSYTPLFIYLMIAIASCFASMSFGVKEIEKVSIRQLGDTGKAEVIEMKITQLQRQAGHKSTKYITGLQSQISDLRGQIPTRGFRVIEKTKEINAEISILNGKIRDASKVKDNENIHSQLAILKSQLAKAKFNSVDTKGSFAIMAGVLGCSVEMIMIVFLAFVTITIEVGIASTSPGVVAGVKAVKKKIKKKYVKGELGQTSLWSFVA